MNNPRMTAKERNLLKGAIRRVFSRSELRRRVLAACKVEHINLSRPRVKTWYYCKSCKGYYAGYQMNVDHIIPIIPVDTSLEDMNWDTVIDRTWCEENNLDLKCLPCHTIKSKSETKERKLYRQKRKIK